MTVVSVQIFLSDYEADFTNMNEAYIAAFPKDIPLPVRTCVGVAALPAKTDIEMTIVSATRSREGRRFTADRRQAGLSRRLRQCVGGLAQLRSQTTAARPSSMHGYKSRHSQMVFWIARIFAKGQFPLKAAALVSDPRWILYDEHSSPRVRADSTSRSIGTKQATSAQQGLAVSSHRVYSASIGVQGVAKPRLVQQDGHELCPASISFQYQTLEYAYHFNGLAWMYFRTLIKAQGDPSLFDPA